MVASRAFGLSNVMIGDRLYLKDLVRNPDLNGREVRVFGLQGDRLVCGIDDRQIAVRFQNASTIRPMPADTTPAWIQHFLQDWGNRIRGNDPTNFASCGSDIYAYLCRKVTAVLGRVRSPNSNTRNFGNRSLGGDYGNVSPAIIWATGQSEAAQLTPLTADEGPYCQWWPCIVVVDRTDFWSFYCPALGWQDARAWTAHRSRVFALPGGQAYLILRLRGGPPLRDI